MKGAAQDRGQREMERVLAHPRFQALVRRRFRLVRALLLVIGVVYFGFILAVGGCPEVLARPVGHGPITLGLYLAGGVAVVAVAVAGFYARRANTVFDVETRHLRETLE